MRRPIAVDAHISIRALLVRGVGGSINFLLGFERTRYFDYESLVGLVEASKGIVQLPKKLRPMPLPSGRVVYNGIRLRERIVVTHAA